MLEVKACNLTARPPILGNIGKLSGQLTWINSYGDGGVFRPNLSASVRGTDVVIGEVDEGDV